MNRSGFTFVEVLMTSAVLVLVGGLILAFAQASQQSWLFTNARLTSLTGAQRALNRVTEDLRVACAGTAQLTPGQVRFKLSPACDADDPEIVYSHVGTNLNRRVGTGGNPATVASGVTSFTASLLPNNVVQVRLAAQGDSIVGNVVQTLTARVWLQIP